MPETSVSNAENRRPIRKSGIIQGIKLPSQMLETSHKDGSQEECGNKNFRPKR